MCGAARNECRYATGYKPNCQFARQIRFRLTMIGKRR
jgi:hypothetical protein